MDNLQDQMLVAASKRGGKSAYSALVKKYYKNVFALSFGIVGNKDDAEDIAQDTMLNGFLKIQTLHKGERFEQWIMRIARNLCIDLIRRRKHVKTILAEEMPEKNYQTTNNNQDVQHCIRQLPLELRLPLVMYYFDEKNTKEISEKLKMSHTTVCARIKEARKRLHKLLCGRDKNE